MSDAINPGLMSQPGMAAAVEAARHEQPVEPNWDEELYWAQQAENRVASQEGRVARELTMEEVRQAYGQPVQAPVQPAQAPPPPPPAPAPPYVPPAPQEPIPAPPVLTSENPRSAGSLGDRMKQRREFMDREHTIQLALPGYEGVLKVEFRTLDWATLRKIAILHENVEDRVTQELYQAADELLWATVQFFEVVPAENPDKVGDAPLSGETWLSLAGRVGRAGGDTTPRQAIIALLRDLDLMLLAQAWRQWNGLIRDEIMEELRQDFGGTR